MGKGLGVGRVSVVVSWYMECKAVKEDWCGQREDPMALKRRAREAQQV